MSISIQEAGDKCLGQTACDDCPRYQDDCNGKEEEEDLGICSMSCFLKRDLVVKKNEKDI